MRRSFLLLPVALVACGGPPATTAGGASEPAVVRVSAARDREDLAITVYNGNFGVVREVRTIDAPRGRVALEFQDVAQHIQPETVRIKSLAAEGSLSVLEQNYRYDLLSPEKLLEKYVGRKVRLYRWNEALGREEPFDAEVVAANETPIFKVLGEITYGFPGRVAFPEVPASLIARPTLVWLLASRAARQRIEVSYMTSEMGWEADYVLSLDEADLSADLVGWVTLTNRSGVAFENAKLKLVAGDVQRIQGQLPTGAATTVVTAAPAAQAAQFKEEGFFEYHLYTLERPTTLLDNEQKQVSLLSATGIKVEKHLRFFGEEAYYRSAYGQIVGNQAVGVYLEIKNEEANNLGMPLPKGTLRVYKADKTGAKQFVGEDSIDHTPRDEKIKLKLGDAFDVVGDRKQTSWAPEGDCASESDWEISIRNHKDADVRVEDFEPVGGDWQILSSSHPALRKDAHLFTFDVVVPKRGETKITYRVRARWC